MKLFWRFLRSEISSYKIPDLFVCLKYQLITWRSPLHKCYVSRVESYVNCACVSRFYERDDCDKTAVCVCTCVRWEISSYLVRRYMDSMHTTAEE